MVGEDGTGRGGRAYVHRINGLLHIDICAVSMECINIIDKFTVVNFLGSDHLPIEVNLKVHIKSAPLTEAIYLGAAIAA